MTRPYRVLCSASDREKWLSLRRSHITASDVAAVLGASKFVSATELHYRKLGKVQEQESSFLMDLGLRMEGFILDLWREYNPGRKARRCQQLLESKPWPWLAATPDATTLDGDGMCPVEIKNPTDFSARDWSSGVPAYYLPQVQAQIAVMGAPRAYVACLAGKTAFHSYTVLPDYAMIDRIVAASKAFLENVWANGPAPDPDGSESAHDALLAIFPECQVGVEVVLPDDAEAWASRLEEVEAAREAADTEREAIRQRIASCIGTAERGILPRTRAVWTWKAGRGGRVLRRVPAGGR